jgi:hypothetical protein
MGDEAFHDSFARLALKHSPHKTGRPLDGLKGTLSVLPH